MINMIMYNLKLDNLYNTNLLIYMVRRIPGFNDIISDNIYNSNIKKILSIISFVLVELFRFIFTFIFCYFIYIIFKYINLYYYLYGFICISIINRCINPKLLKQSLSKYICINILNENSYNCIKYNILFDFIQSCLFNIVSLLIIYSIYNINYSFIDIVTSVILCNLVNIVLEYINIYYYNNNGFVLSKKISNILSIIFIGFIIFILFIINKYVLYILFVLLMFISIYCFFKLIKFDNYKVIYKRLMNKNNIRNNKNNYYEIDDVEVNSNKNGIDYFNYIFNIRNKTNIKSIVLNSCLFIFIVFGLLVYFKDSINILDNINYILIIIFMVNIGTNMTNLYYYNCDINMNNYKFYDRCKYRLYKLRLIDINRYSIITCILLFIFSCLILIINNYINIWLFINIFILIISISIMINNLYLFIYYVFNPYIDNLFNKFINSIVIFGLLFLFYKLVNIFNIYYSFIFIICCLVCLFIFDRIVYYLFYKN